MVTNIGHGTKQYSLLSPPRREPSAVGAWDVLALLQAGGCELLCEEGRELVRELVHTCEFVRYPRCGSRINDDRVTKLSLHHPIS